MTDYIAELLNTVLSRNYMEFNTTRGIMFDSLTDIILSAGPNGIIIGKRNELQTINLRNVKLVGTVNISDLNLSGSLNTQMVTNIYDTDLNCLVDSETGKITGHIYGTQYGNVLGSTYGYINSYGSFIGDTLANQLKISHVVDKTFNNFVYSLWDDTFSYTPIIEDPFFGRLRPAAKTYAPNFYLDNYKNNIIYDTDVIVNIDMLTLKYEPSVTNIKADLSLSIYNKYRYCIDKLEYTLYSDPDDIDIRDMSFINTSNYISLNGEILNSITPIDKYKPSEYINTDITFQYAHDNIVFQFAGSIINNILYTNTELVRDNILRRDVILDFPLPSQHFMGFIGDSDVLYVGMLNMLHSEDTYNNRNYSGLLVERFYTSKLNTFVKLEDELLLVDHNNSSTQLISNNTSGDAHISFPFGTAGSSVEIGDIVLLGYNNDSGNNTEFTKYLYTHIDTWVRYKLPASFSLSDNDFMVTNNFNNTRFAEYTQDELLNKAWYLYNLETSNNVFGKLSFRNGEGSSMYVDGEATFLFMGPLTNTHLDTSHTISFDYTGSGDTNDTVSLISIDYCDWDDGFAYNIDKLANITHNDNIWTFGDFDYDNYPDCFIFKNGRYSGITGVYIYIAGDNTLYPNIYVSNSDGIFYKYTVNDTWVIVEPVINIKKTVYALVNNDTCKLCSFSETVNYERRINVYGQHNELNLYAIRVGIHDNILYYMKRDRKIYRVDTPDIMININPPKIYSYTNICFKLSKTLAPIHTDNYMKNVEQPDFVKHLHTITNNKDLTHWSNYISNTLDPINHKNKRIYGLYYMKNCVSSVSEAVSYYIANIKISKIPKNSYKLYKQTWHVVDSSYLKDGLITTMDNNNNNTSNNGVIRFNPTIPSTGYLVIGPISPIYDFRPDMLTRVVFNCNYHVLSIDNAVFNIYKCTSTVDLSAANSEYVRNLILKNLGTPLFSINNITKSETYSDNVFDRFNSTKNVYYILEVVGMADIIINNIVFKQNSVDKIQLDLEYNLPVNNNFLARLKPLDHYFTGLEFVYNFTKNSENYKLKDTLRFKSDNISININTVGRKLITLTNITNTLYKINNICGITNYDNLLDTHKNIVCTKNNIYSSDIYGWVDMCVSKLDINMLAILSNKLEYGKYLVSFKYTKNTKNDKLYCMYKNGESYTVLLDTSAIFTGYHKFIVQTDEIRFVALKTVKDVMDIALSNIEILSLVDANAS